jgi:hypothetical protein
VQRWHRSESLRGSEGVNHMLRLQLHYLNGAHCDLWRTSWWIPREPISWAGHAAGAVHGAVPRGRRGSASAPGAVPHGRRGSASASGAVPRGRRGSASAPGAVPRGRRDLERLGGMGEPGREADGAPRARGTAVSRCGRVFAGCGRVTERSHVGGEPLERSHVGGEGALRRQGRSHVGGETSSASAAWANRAARPTARREHRARRSAAAAESSRDAGGSQSGPTWEASP